jgi:hypothetical protein
MFRLYFLFIKFVVYNKSIFFSLNYFLYKIQFFYLYCCILRAYIYSKNRFTIINKGSFFFISDLLLLPDESTYYLFSIFYDFYFFCYLFMFNFLINCFVYFLFMLFIFFVSFFKFLFFGKFFCIYFFYVFFIFVLVFDLFFLFLIFVSFNFFIFFFDKFFKTPFAGLIFLSKDFLTIEDEDLWVSSNIFYLDLKLIQSDALNIPLKVQEIDVFFTLVTLFFDTQKMNVDYFQYTSDLNLIKEDKDSKKYFRRSKNKSMFNFSKELEKLRSQQHLNQFRQSADYRPSKLFGFYKKFFRSVGLSSGSLHLNRKKNILKRKQFKNRNFNFLNSISFQKHRIEPGSFTPFQNENLTNDLILLRVLRSYKNLNERIESPLNIIKHKNFRENSRFLNFFWFSFPFYLYQINYSISFLNSIILRQSFFLKKICYKIFYFFYFFLFPSNNPSLYIRQNFFNFKDFSLADKKNFDLNFNKLVESYLFILQSNKENQLDDNIDPGKFSMNIVNFSADKKLSKQNQSESLKKKRKNKRDYKRLFRKPITSEYVRVISKKNLKFINEYNLILYKKYPTLRVLDLYKILEYFYFVITNDVDFYESVTFAAKVAVLRDKYGQAIVNDLLSKEDHKQSENVSVQMHYTANQLPYFEELSERSSIIAPINVDDNFKESNHIKEVNDSNIIISAHEKFKIKKKFKFKSIELSSNISNFSKNLLLSYRYRFRS